VNHKYTSARVAAGIVGFADITLGERVRETLEAHVQAANGRFSGVRQRAKWDSDPACGSPVSADRAGLYLEPAFGEGYAGRDRENHTDWLAGMKELASCPNVTVKMGGLLMNLANFDFKTAAAPPSSMELAKLWSPYIEPCIELFGAGRCMVSSNFPVDKAGFGYGTVWNMFKRITAGCSAAEKRLLFSDTAKRVYLLDDVAR
jgi:L-fuconolactonase